MPKLPQTHKACLKVAKMLQINRLLFTQKAPFFLACVASSD